ncbi:NRDE family protein [Microbacterium sp. zg-B185]|nr:NRDE family protein [Microbacterium sp. zg-B185]MCR2810912.1 NRDE family protein [Microbacterium sp. zg.B185]WIM20958.1 NRDE family protein [Microbacterium sp. zg-B185]
MCTVIVRVPTSSSLPTRVLAIRDEDPERPWSPLGRWWPESHGGVVGVRDLRAGGAWLAADSAAGRLAVLLNRADVSTLPESQLVSRGGLALDSVAGRTPAQPRTHGFNLVEVEGARTSVVSWDGQRLSRVELTPGTHMVAHDDVDDPSTPRIARWLAEFAAVELPETDTWWTPWIELLERSSALESTDDEAIIRDNRPHGYPTQSLLVCVASVTADDIQVRYRALREPGRWNRQLDGVL